MKLSIINHDEDIGHQIQNAIDEDPRISDITQELITASGAFVGGYTLVNTISEDEEGDVAIARGFKNSTIVKNCHCELIGESSDVTRSGEARILRTLVQSTPYPSRPSNTLYNH